MPKTRVKRALKLLGLFGVFLQSITIALLFVVDAFRKRRTPQHPFPHVTTADIPTGGSSVRVYTLGRDVYDAMLAEIEAAENYVYFETYIWKSDATGHRFKDALIAAAERGIRVHVAYDVIGNLVVDQAFFEFPKSIQVIRHRPFTGVRTWRPRFPGLNHRKMLVVDGKSAFIGGYNIGDLYAERWRDTHVRITGPAVGELEDAFVDYWNRALPRGSAPLSVRARRYWQSPIRLARNVPSVMVYPIRYLYLDAIDRAADRVWLTHAYLMPDDDMLDSLIGAANRGVDVRVIVPAQSNHIVADWISRSFYQTYLQHGIRIFLFQGAMVHAKTATVDGEWSTIGTANLDRLSLVGNFELNIEVTDSDVAAHMEEIFNLDLTNCVELTLEEWQARPLMSKISEWLLLPLRPLL